MDLKYRLVAEDGVPQEPTYSHGRVLDISEGGMFIKVDRIIRIGQKLEVYARKQDHSAAVRGIVVAVRQVPEIDTLVIWSGSTSG